MSALGEGLRVVAEQSGSWLEPVELRAAVRGVGLWTPNHPSFADWIAAGMPGDFQARTNDWQKPPAELLHPRLRRRTSTLTRAAVTALEAALAGSGVAVSDVRLVLVSSFGEIETTVELLAQLAEPGGPVSPTKFHNSVHNTATGYMSIASGNNRESTALAGGPHNLEIGLLETLAGLCESGGDAVLIFAEELLPHPFEREEADPSFAVALHLATSVATAEAAAALELCLTQGPVAALSNQPLTPGVAGLGLPTMISPLVELLRAIAEPQHERGPIALAGRDPAVDAAWTASLLPSG